MGTEEREFISDYDENKDEIEYWLSIKCVQKYRRFAQLLQDKGIERTWKNVSGLYRYDKRLLFNIFRYISFEEEYLRASVVKLSGNPEGQYDKLQAEKLVNLIEVLKKLCKDENDSYFDDLGKVRKLRNAISHNKILLEEKNLADEIYALHRVLPEQYKDSFFKEIDGCVKDIDVAKHFHVNNVR